MDRKALAIANNDLVYLWWTYAAAIPECLGFSIRRLQEGREPVALPAFVGFEPGQPGDGARAESTTDYWPIQSYQWKDLFVPEEREVRYEIVPMTGTPGRRLRDVPDLSVRTNPIKATDRVGRHQVIFNRGILSTQALTAALSQDGAGGASLQGLRGHIDVPGDVIRARLAGESIRALTGLLARARRYGGRCYCALYELTDPELRAAIAKTKGRVEVILSNANSTVEVAGKSKTVYDGTNADARTELRAVLGPDFHDRLLPKGNAIGHNKFVVYVDPAGTPKSVVTGSTNWTASGLCAQSNNVLVLNDEAIAARYLDYWKLLLGDEAKQQPPLRRAGAQQPPDLPLGRGRGHARVWFSPNTTRKTKPPQDPPAPPDMAEVFEAIGEAEHGVLFLLFSAGAPSILERIAEVERERSAARRSFFVRGAISDAQTARKYATRVYNDSVLEGPNTLVTGIAGVRDQFSFWEEELAKLGHAVIHDKVLVIDPFTDRSLVATGSHNLGYKASYSNDENLCLVRGNQPLAHAYAAHVLDIVNHYNWRYNLPPGNAGAVAAGARPRRRFEHLDKTPGWQSKYFRGDFLASRDRFFFPA